MRADEVRRWWTLEQRTHTLVLSALRRTLESVGMSADLQRGIDRLLHVVLVRRVWLERVRGVPESGFRETATLDELSGEMDAVDRAWDGYLQTLDDAALERPTEYGRAGGPRWRLSVGDVMFHLATHSAYHRGQIASDIVRAGGVAPETGHAGMVRAAIV